MEAITLLLMAAYHALSFLKIRESRNEKEKRLKDAALEAFRDAIVKTRSYLADRREATEYRNRDKEVEISSAWNTVALRIKNIESKEANELYEVCFLKADYWSDPIKWQENQEIEIDISLERVNREISHLLK